MKPQSKSKIAYQKSLDLLRKAITPNGLVASISDISNYKRIWSRDSVICGLAGLLAEEEAVTVAFRNSLIALAENQAPHGQIPSNVQYSETGDLLKVSYGGLCGRVDAVTWWIIGLCNYAKWTGDTAFALQYQEQVERCFHLLQAWEFNDRGLLYVPQSGNWADEYILHAYVLYDQLLRFWALQTAAAIFERADWAEKAKQLRIIIEQNYWVDREEKTNLYHPFAYQRLLEKRGSSKFWEASFSPGGYIRKFDLLGNSLCLLLKIGSPEQRSQLLENSRAIQGAISSGLMPAFWPAIFEGDPEWFFLESNYAYEFRNKPYEFQNGGIWPVFNGWWGAGLYAAGEKTAADALLENLAAGVAKEDWSFYECLNGQTGEPHGTQFCTWSAAGIVFLAESLNGKQLYYGRDNQA